MEIEGDDERFLQVCMSCVTLEDGGLGDFENKLLLLSLYYPEDFELLVV